MAGRRKTPKYRVRCLDCMFEVEVPSRYDLVRFVVLHQCPNKGAKLEV